MVGGRTLVATERAYEPTYKRRLPAPLLLDGRTRVRARVGNELSRLALIGSGYYLMGSQDELLDPRADLIG